MSGYVGEGDIGGSRVSVEQESRGNVSDPLPGVSQQMGKDR